MRKRAFCARSFGEIPVLYIGVTFNAGTHIISVINEAKAKGTLPQAVEMYAVPRRQYLTATYPQQAAFVFSLLLRDEDRVIRTLIDCIESAFGITLDRGQDMPPKVARKYTLFIVEQRNKKPLPK